MGKFPSLLALAQFQILGRKKKKKKKKKKSTYGQILARRLSRFIIPALSLLNIKEDF
jgi:hypothetical protein